MISRLVSQARQLRTPPTRGAMQLQGLAQQIVHAQEVPDHSPHDAQLVEGVGQWARTNLRPSPYGVSARSSTNEPFSTSPCGPADRKVGRGA
jgi:hypothetical protein